MMNLYELRFTVDAKVEAYSEEQIRDRISLAIGKMITETFGFSGLRNTIEIVEIKETEYPEDTPCAVRGA
jgi:hypothetical protein